MANQSPEVRWSLGILAITWAMVNVCLLVMMHRASEQDPHALVTYLGFLVAVQAVCGWAYFGVRDQQRKSPPGGHGETR